MRILKIIFVLVILLTVAHVNAQSSIQPSDTTFNYDKALRPCIQVNIDPEPKTLKKAWKKYLKDNYKVNLKGIGFLSNKDLLSAKEITLTQISSKTMDFFTYIVEDEYGSEMKVFIRFGYDIYLTKENSPNEYLVLNEIIKSFLKYYLPKYYKGQINDTEKRINTLTRESTNLKKSITSNYNRIDKLNSKIKQQEEELRLNKAQLEVTEIKLIKRKEKLDRIQIQLLKLN